jgi:hypothetical protein
MRTKGSVLIVALLSVFVLALLAASVIELVTNKYLTVFQAASWQEAILATESGVDLAMVELRKSLSDPSSAWQSPWSGGAPRTGNSASCLSTITYLGEGSTTMNLNVSVDAPAQLVDSKGWQYYRIRATGTNLVPGPQRTGDEARDTELRKLSILRDRLTGTALLRPLVSRRVEVIAKPLSPYNAAILARGDIDFTNHNIIIDSYDSRDPAKSTSGQYDSGKRQRNGDVYSNGTMISAGNAHIYGDIGTNAGTATGVANVTGVQRTDFYQDIKSIPSPGWTTGIAMNPNSVNNTTTIPASSTKGACKYKLSKISLSGQDVLTISGAADGSPTYVDIWVTGDISVSGKGEIHLEEGVIASIYLAGNASISGNGITNGSSTTCRPANVNLFGIKPASGTPYIALSGNAAMQAAIYAPDATISINGGGSNGTFSGAIVGKTVTMTGVTNVHYDEALAAAGFVTDYKIASWFEDTSRNNIW